MGTRFNTVLLMGMAFKPNPELWEDPAFEALFNYEPGEFGIVQPEDDSENWFIGQILSIITEDSEDPSYVIDVDEIYDLREEITKKLNKLLPKLAPYNARIIHIGYYS